MKHRGSFPHRMDEPDRHNERRDKQTNEWTDERTDGRPETRICPFFVSYRWSLTLYSGFNSGFRFSILLRSLC